METAKTDPMKLLVILLTAMIGVYGACMTIWMLLDPINRQPTIIDLFSSTMLIFPVVVYGRREMPKLFKNPKVMFYTYVLIALLLFAGIVLLAWGIPFGDVSPTETYVILVTVLLFIEDARHEIKESKKQEPQA